MARRISVTDHAEMQRLFVAERERIRRERAEEAAWSDIEKDEDLQNLIATVIADYFPYHDLNVLGVAGEIVDALRDKGYLEDDDATEET